MRAPQDSKNFYWVNGPLFPAPPEGLLPIEEHLLFTTIQVLLEKRGWELEWLEINLDTFSLDINHPSISREEATEFFNELFERIGGTQVE